MEMLTGIRLVWLLNGFINTLELIFIIDLVQFLNPQLFVLFSVLPSVMVGLFANSMLIMTFSRALLLRMSSWHNHKASSIKTILNMSTSFTRHYGLKQATHAWYHELHQFLVITGYTNSHADTFLFVFNNRVQ